MSFPKYDLIKNNNVHNSSPRNSSSGLTSKKIINQDDNEFIKL